MKKLSKVHAAYIAGIVDGEGYVGISRNKTKLGLRGFRYRGRIQIEMTNYPLLKWILNKSGVGAIVKRPIRNARWKRQHNFVVADKEIIPFLIPLIPFLRIKKKQAEILINYRRTLKRPGVKGHGKAAKKSQDLAYCNIRNLNKRGPK